MLLIFILIAAILVRYAFVRQSKRQRVDHYYWLQSAEAFRTQRRLPFSLNGQFLLEDSRQSYPPFFAILLSLFPRSFLRQHGVLISQMADFWVTFLVVVASQGLGAGSLATVCGVAIVGFAPVMVAYNTQINPRSWGNLFLTLKLLAEITAVGGGTPALWVVAVFATALVFLTHKMTTQLMLFLWLPFATVHSSWLAFWTLPAGLALSVSMTGVRFAILQWRAHFDIVTFWNRHWRSLGVHAFGASKAYGDPNSASGFHKSGLKGTLFYCRLIVGYIPALLPLPLLLPFAPMPPVGILVWFLGSIFFACLTLIVPRMKCLGGGHYYAFNAVAPGAIWWSVALKENGTLPLVLFAFAVFLSVLTLVLGYRHRGHRAAPGDDALSSIIRYLSSLPAQRLAVFPLQSAEVIAAETSHCVLWGGHGYGFRRLEPIFPVVRQPLADFFSLHKVDAVLLDRRYWPDGEAKLRSEGTIDSTCEIGPWVLAPVSATPAPVFILIVTRSLDIGGTERHILAIAAGLRDSGFRVELAVLHPGGALEANFRDENIVLHSVCPETNHLKAMQHLRSLYIELRPDVIHFFLPEAYLIGGLAALELDGPSLVMSRRSRNEYQKVHPIAARVERLLHRRMVALIANSPVVLEDLRFEGAKEEQLHLIPNGLVTRSPCLDRCDVRAQLGISNSALVFVLVANLIPYKGHSEVLTALAQVARDLPNEWRLLCVGRDDGIGSALRNKGERLGLSSQILWLGQRSDVSELLAASDIALSASHQEGFSNAIIEAMAAGLPVIATAVGGSTEVIRTWTDGVLVPPRHPEALAEAIRVLARDSDLREQLGSSARARAQTEYSLATCIDLYAALYSRLVHRESIRA